MRILHAIAQAIFGKLSFCALVGGMIGSVAGFLFSMLQFQHSNLVLSASEVIWMGVVLGVLGWATVLIVVGLWLHYGVRQIALPALVNGLLTGILTVFISDLVQRPEIGTLIGLVIGIVVGTVLCRLCRWRMPKERKA